MSALRDATIGDYLEEVASATPTPGGGSVAAVVAALASALGSMVTAISAAKSTDDYLKRLAAKCASYSELFLQLAAEDEAAFEAVMAALSLPQGDPSRTARLESCVQAAAQTPLAVARTCLELLAVLASLATSVSRHCVSDVGAAAHLALAALRTSLLNVSINITFMKDADAAATFDAAAASLEADGQARSQQIVDQVVARIRG